MSNSLYTAPAQASNAAVTPSAVAKTETPAATPPAKATAVRLPNTARPVSYKLLIEPNAEKGEFSGIETITLDLLKPTKEIVVNGIEMKVTSAQCFAMSPHVAPVYAAVAYRPVNEQIAFQMPHELSPGRYDLRLEYYGIINDKLHGLYRASYTDASGQKQWLATTQMESIDARRMFPCFDEPEYKATFNLTASIAPKLMAISNGAVIENRIDADAQRRVVRFAETPKMSTYLVALIVGHLVPSEIKISDGVPVRVWTIPGHEKMAGYALDVATKLLPFYNKYFGVPYPTKKLDLIGIPDFAAGAMENLGAITFRETYLLIDEKEGSTEAKQDIASTIAHEMAHMWFGDLVTMKWWDDLWLNEAFATWMSYKAVDFLRPDWHSWDGFCSQKLQSMATDCMLSTRPIHFSVTDPTQVEQMFDEITYGKGASVLRMLEKYVGEDTFKNGVQEYIKAHQFGNATTRDLWNSIGHACGKDINELMHNWVYEPGYPLVTLKEDDSTFSAAQERFLVSPDKPGTSPSTMWRIPVALGLLPQSRQKMSPVWKLFEERNADFPTGESFKPADPKSGEVVVCGSAPRPTDGMFYANAGGEGYYRVRYALPQLKILGARLSELSVLERADLLSDQFYLALAGDIPVQEFMALTASYKEEKDPNVMEILTHSLETIDILVDDASRPAFAAFVRDRLGNAKRSLGWEAKPGDTDLTKVLRADVLNMLATRGQDQPTIDEARQLFAKYLADPSSIDPDLVDTIVDIVAYNGDANDYAKIEKLWHEAKAPEREKAALMALGLFRDPALIQKTLDMTITDKVRTQDGPKLLSETASTVAGRQLGWSFTKQHFKTLGEKFSKHQLPAVIASAASLTTPAELVEVREFFKNNAIPEVSHKIAKTIELIEISVAFKNRSGAALADWLAADAKAKNIKVDENRIPGSQTKG